MVDASKITGITVFIEVDGKTCLAPINPEATTLFVGMLPAFQTDPKDAKTPRLYALPPTLVAPLEAWGQAFREHLLALKKPKEQAS